MRITKLSAVARSVRKRTHLWEAACEKYLDSHHKHGRCKSLTDQHVAKTMALLHLVTRSINDAWKADLFGSAKHRKVSRDRN
jgi:hypothetical protein